LRTIAKRARGCSRLPAHAATIAANSSASRGLGLGEHKRAQLLIELQSRRLAWFEPRPIRLPAWTFDPRFGDPDILGHGWSEKPASNLPALVPVHEARFVTRGAMSKTA
jgi:hypothetical protein